MSTRTPTGSRMGAVLARISRMASPQHGNFTHRQALKCGASPRTIHRYVAEGRWRRMHRGVYAVNGKAVDDLQRASAAVLAAGPTARLSHMSAVALYGLTPWPLQIHLTVPHGRHRTLRGVNWHQSRVVDADLATINGIPTTTLERTLLDAATQADRQLLVQLVDEAVRLGMTDVGTLAAKALIVRPDGRFGGRRLRAVLAGVPPLEDADSIMEMLMARLLDATGLDGYVHHHLVVAGGTRFELDFGFPHERVDVECDGAAHHGGPLSLAADRLRDEALAAEGWTVLRFKWNDVTRDASRTAHRVRVALGR